MTNTLPPPTEPTEIPVVPNPPSVRKRWTILAAVAAAIVIFAGVLTAVSTSEPKIKASAEVSPVATDAPTTTVAPTTATPTIPPTIAPTTEAPVTTVKPECTQGAGETRNATDESYDVYVCRQGTWQFDRTVVIPPPTIAPTTTEAPPVTEAPTTLPPAPIEFVDIDARTWKLIAKDPDAHKGEYIRVYGVVTQFDSATGGLSFRARIDGAPHSDAYDFDTNTFLLGKPELLADVVEDDEFVAEVMVIGSFTYDTQIGGSTTVPSLAVLNIVVTG